MGDCRIRITVSMEVLALGKWGTGRAPSPTTIHAPSPSSGPFVFNLSSDSTIHDLLRAQLIDDGGSYDDVQGQPRISLWELCQAVDARIWDCTLHPPTDVTQLVREYPDLQGPSSLTLYAAGWFPSGSLQVLPNGMQPALPGYELYEDIQFPSAGSGKVRAIAESSVDASQDSVLLLQTPTTVGTGISSSAPIKPSELLHSVTTRFVDVGAVDDQHGKLMSRSTAENHNQAVRHRHQRQERLYAQMTALRKQATSTAEQVRRMLIKNTANGRHGLGMEDRIHLECYRAVESENADNDDILLIGENVEYRFFSPQDTMGKVIDSFPRPVSNLRGEVLVMMKGTDVPSYRRIPTLLRLHEALDANYIHDFDVVVLRFYDPQKSEATPTIVEDCAASIRFEGIQLSSTSTELMQINCSPTHTVITKCTLMDILNLQAALCAWDEANSKHRKSTNINPSVVRVKHMQIKSKAHGDTRRIKVENRFFFELVVAHGKTNAIQSITPVFMSLSDPIQRIRRDLIKTKDTTSTCQFFVAKGFDNATILSISDPSRTFAEIQQQGILEPCVRIIVRLDL